MVAEPRRTEQGLKIQQPRVEGSRIEGGPRDQSSGIAFGTPSIRGQTLAQDVNQAPGASRQNPIGSGRPMCVVTPPPLCMCSRQLLLAEGISQKLTIARCVWAVIGEHSETDLSECSGAVQECRHFAVYIGWDWSQEHVCQWSCSLGQLGRLPSDEPRSAPSCRHCASSPFGRRCCHPLLFF